MKNENLFNRLKAALVEKDVEDVYREVLRIAFPGSNISSPYKTDGVLKDDTHNLIALLEFKLDYNLKKRIDIATVLTQALFYLKKFPLPPTILFVGDINECFCMHTNELLKYFDFEGVKWSGAPSTAAKYNPDLTMAIFNDGKILPYVFDVDKNFRFPNIATKMLDLNGGIVRLVQISDQNINTIFEYFCKNVIKKQKNFSTNALVGMFLQLLINPSENYIHPIKKNMMVIKGKDDIKISVNKFKTFFAHFERDYKPSEKERMIEIADRLLEDETRRREGAFFTPTDWVDEAHKMLDEQLGEDWRDEYVVWDCACGTGNLTRDYQFKELYCSTLMEEEIELMKQSRISNDAKDRFTYDFLNTTELPKGISQAIEDGRKVLFLINPPFGRATSKSQRSNDNNTTGLAETNINKMMKRDSLGQSASNLYAQFIYRICKFRDQSNNITIGFFCKPLFLTGKAYKNFRHFFLNRFKMIYGMIFQASHFSGVSSQWGIIFSIWLSGQSEKTDSFKFEVKDNVMENI